MFLGKKVQLSCHCQLMSVLSGGGIRVLQMGLGYLQGAVAFLTVVKLPLKLSETVFLHSPTQRMTHSQGCLGNLATHFCWEATRAEQPDLKHLSLSAPALPTTFPQTNARVLMCLIRGVASKNRICLWHQSS